MPYTIVTTTNSRLDIQDAIDWENQRSQGLAIRFLEELDQKLSAISHTPYIAAVRYENVRCLPTKVFNYLIHYVVVIPKKKFTSFVFFIRQENLFGKDITEALFYAAWRSQEIEVPFATS